MSSLRQTTPVSIMRPPKPPSWRDFVATDAPHSSGKLQTPTPSPFTSDPPPAPVCRVFESKSTTQLHDAVEMARADTCPSVSTSRLYRPSRNRPRARIHRTSSEQVILSKDLPPNDPHHTPKDAAPPLAPPLAPRPQQVSPNSPEQHDMASPTEIARRCQSWLASIEACEPLDEVSYTARTPPGRSSSSAAATVTVTHSSEESGGEGSRVCYPTSADSDTFPLPLHSFGDDVDVEIPDEMVVWPMERRASSPVCRDHLVYPLTIGLKNDKSAKVTKCSINRSGSQSDAIVSRERRAVSEKSARRVEFVDVCGDGGGGDSDLDGSLDEEDNNDRDSTRDSTARLCCDICITFTCYRRKEVKADS